MMSLITLTRAVSHTQDLKKTEHVDRKLKQADQAQMLGM